MANYKERTNFILDKAKQHTDSEIWKVLSYPTAFLSVTQEYRAKTEIKDMIFRLLNEKQYEK